MEKLIALADLFRISLDELVLDKKPAGDGFSAQLMTQKNKQKFKKWGRIAVIALAVLLAVDVISMIVYYLIWGFPG